MRRHTASPLVFLLPLAVLTAGSAPAPEARAPGPTTVRVASYNAWLLPIGADDTDERRDRMGPAIAALEPDVVCLQEVWTEQALEPVAEALADRLPEVATGGGGLVVLSRWPLRDVTFTAYPASTAASLAERFARKGWLSAVVETPAGPLRVVDSHLAFDREEGRPRQAAQLALLADDLRTTGVPTLLCADLNQRGYMGGSPSAGYAQLLDLGFRDAASAASDARPGVRVGTRVGWPRGGRTAGWDPDYVLYRGGDSADLDVASFRQALETEATALSDHNLQLADFVLEP